MGKLKTYQTAGIARTGMDQLSEQPFRETELANERVSTFLAQAQQTFTEKANVYAEEQAIKDAITSPITKEQIDQARQTGGNPISEFLKGGTTYNKAAQQILGQQVAGELRLELDQMSADVLEQVRTGDITNQAQALEKLQEPISAHVEFLSTIDPKIAEGYGAQATASVRNYFSQADTVIRNKEEEKRQINAQQMFDNMVRDYENFLLANPNVDQNVKDEYKSVIENMARDMSFSLTRKQEVFSQKLNEALQLKDFDHYAKVIANKNIGKTIQEVIESLPSDKSVEASYYMQATNKEAFESLIDDHLRNQNAKVQAQDKEAATLINRLQKNYTNRGKRVPPSELERASKLVGPNSNLIKALDMLTQTSDNIEQLNNTPFDKLSNELAELVRIDKSREDLTNEQTERLAYLAPYVKNIVDAIDADPVNAILSRSGLDDPIDFSNIEAVKDSVTNRRQVLDANAKFYGINKQDVGSMILTKSEASNFVAMYTNPETDGATRLAMLSTIDNAFGASANAAYKQLSSAGLPVTAQLSSFISSEEVSSKLIALDSEEKRKELKDLLDTSGESRNLADIKKEIRSDLREYEAVLRRNTPLDASVVNRKLNTMVDTLAYYAISRMEGKEGLSDGMDEAVDLITDNHHIEETYYIPTVFNGDDITSDIERSQGIIDKAETIAAHHLQDFNPVPFDSQNQDVTEEDKIARFEMQLENFGEWRNHPDGTGLVYVIQFDDGTFLPIRNQSDEYLYFSFDDLSNKVPGTIVEIDYDKATLKDFIDLTETKDTELGL